MAVHYSREVVERRKAIAEKALKTGNFGRLSRAEVKENIRYLTYILKKMGSQDSVEIPSTILNRSPWNE